MMRFETLNDAEKEMRNQVAELIHMRRNSMPLLYGDFIPVESTPEQIIFERIYMGQRVTVTINRKDLTYQITKD